MFAPNFVFSITASLVAERYLRTSLEIDTIAYKFSVFMNTVYVSENAENLKNSAQAFIYSMAEAGIENADAILINYQHEKFFQKPNGRLRNWAPIFGNPIQGIKKKVYTSNSINRDFKAFVYRTKQSGEYACPPGWSLGSQKSCPFLSDINDLEVSAFDIINSSN